MSACFAWLLLIFAAVFVMVSLLRWFEQTLDAADERQWSKLMLLVVAPLTTWMYPSKVAAGRPRAVPKHEPVRGFGEPPPLARRAAESTSTNRAEDGPAQDAAAGPPPGTPAEFLGMP